MTDPNHTDDTTDDTSIDIDFGADPHADIHPDVARHDNTINVEGSGGGPDRLAVASDLREMADKIEAGKTRVANHVHQRTGVGHAGDTTVHTLFATMSERDDAE